MVCHWKNGLSILR